MKPDARTIVSLTVILSVFIVLVSQLSPVSATAASHNLTIYLILNNTADMVYVSPAGAPVSAGSLGSGTTYSHPTHSYIASYSSSNLLSALIALDSTYIKASTQGTNHMLEMNQNITDYYIITFTNGDWRKIDDMISIIETGDFMQEISPSFAYGLGLKYPIKMVLNCSGIDVQSNLILNPGTHEILLDYNQTDPTTNRPVMSISTI